MPRRATKILTNLTNLAVLVVCSLSFTTACSADETRAPMTFDQDLASKVAERKQHPELGPVPLKSLTTFEWDAVFAYMSGAKAEEINRDVGHVVLDPDTFFASGVGSRVRNSNDPASTV